MFQPDPRLFASLLAQVENLGRLVEDLRVVGLADGGHLTLQVAQCDLAAGIRGVPALVEPDLRVRGFVLEAVLPADPVRCDPARMRQALLALLDNAKNHAAPGRLQVAPQVDAGSATLAVTDAGPGIAPAFAATMFDAFQRGARWKAAAGGGSTFALSWPVADGWPERRRPLRP